MVGEATEAIPCTIDVHQGDNLTPLLFNTSFQVALDLPESILDIPIPTFRYFHTAKSGKPCNRL
eukprot:8410059-Ditylum_brightwellii.AAC.1